MTREEIKTENKKFEEYTKALKYVYADGTVSSAERARLITLKNELGLTDSDCQNLEGPYKLIAGNAEKNERTTFEDLCKCHHCHCFDHDGEIHFHTIDYSPIEYLEIGDTYIEITAAGFTGLKENFAVSIGQSFKDLIYEYGEEHIYDAVKDGKLQTFDDSCNYDDMVGWIITKFNILTQEEVSESYTNLLNRAFFPTKKLEINNAEQSLTDLANVIKNKSFLTLQNPELNEVIFDYGSFGDLTTKESKQGYGIVHIIQRRAEIDNLSSEEISSLLLLVKYFAETEKPESYDKSKTRAFINKNGIRVVLQKNWQGNENTWIVSGYGLYDSNDNLKLEAIETIKAVPAQYGYKPELSFLREQVGATIASIGTIRQQQLKVKQLKESIRIEKGTKRISSANPHNVYDKAVIKSSPKNCSDKELLNSLSAAIYAQNALKNANNSELYKHTKNKKILETAGNQKLIDGVTNELQSRGYVLNIESTLNETNIHFQHQVFVDIGKDREKKIDIEKESLNQQGWERKYDSLSSEKLVDFIHNDSFTFQMAESVLADFESVGTPLVIDELGNVCERNLLENEESKSIIDYMPSGITTKEIEILEDYLTSHSDISAEQRVKILKFKDTLEEINEQLFEREENMENNLEKSKSDKEIIQDYISKIKETLPASMKNSVETVLASSAKALSSFSKEEKLVIGKYLTENGVTNSDNLGNFLKKKVEPEHKKELKRDIEIERGR